jgi:hypothetical protein
MIASTRSVPRFLRSIPSKVSHDVPQNHEAMSNPDSRTTTFTTVAYSLGDWTLAGCVAQVMWTVPVPQPKSSEDADEGTLRDWVRHGQRVHGVDVGCWA